jgi:GSH-dependent disulfide-bond oxidoreductase
MIDCYTWKTSNGRKVTIMLEEIQIPYRLHPIDIGKDDQFRPEYVKLNPNSKIPTIVDQDGPGGKPFRVIESGAILMYLAEKTGKLMPQDTRARYEVIQWVMFQMGGVGPNFGQMHHFNRAAKEKVPYALTRFGTEVKRLYGVLNARLAEGPYLAGEYSIADICTYPWVVRHEWQNVDLNEFPNVKRWYDAISVRPAVQKGLELP